MAVPPAWDALPPYLGIPHLQVFGVTFSVRSTLTTLLKLKLAPPPTPTALPPLSATTPFSPVTFQCVRSFVYHWCHLVSISLHENASSKRAGAPISFTDTLQAPGTVPGI